jgi:hypothetical protein
MMTDDVLLAMSLQAVCENQPGAIPQMETDPDGNQTWWLDGQLHRTDGPAVSHASGRQEWYHHGQLHRTDGPALIHANGTQEWHVNDKNVTLQVVAWMSNGGASWPWDTSTQLEFVLTLC